MSVILTKQPTPITYEVALAAGGSVQLQAQPAQPFIFAQQYAQFFGISSQFGLPDYSGTIAAGAAVPFPEVGPSSGALAPTALSASTWQLPVAGTYQVTFALPITEANAELGLALDGVLLQTPVCVAGRTAAGAMITGSFVFATAAPHVLSIINPVGAPAPLTVTPKAGGSNAVSATLFIQQIG